ncbi:MAG: PKD domain-containing protein, partial [Planctomycetota bacterium]
MSQSRKFFISILILSCMIITSCGPFGAGPWYLILQNLNKKKKVKQPAPVVNLHPENESMGIFISSALSWNSAEGADSYDIYFGSNFTEVRSAINTDSVFVVNQPETSYSFSHTLEYGTTYFWRIDSVNRAGTTKGEVWKFTTFVPPPPEAGFSAAPTEGNGWIAANFTNLSTGIFSSLEWDFNNDGIIDSTEENPAYTFSNPGIYDVSLKVTGPGGSDTELKTGCVVVNARLQICSEYGEPYPFIGTGWFRPGTNITASVDSIVSVEEHTRQRCSGFTGTGSVSSSGSGVLISFDITTNSTLTWNWETEHELTVISPAAAGSPTGAGWYGEGSTVSSSVNSPVLDGDEIKYICTGWTGTGSAPESGTETSTGTFILEEPSTVSWNWKCQYFLIVTSDYGSPTGDGWYDDGTAASSSVLNSPVDIGEGIRQRCTGWTGTGSAPAEGTGRDTGEFILEEPSTVIWHWRRQYYLTVNSERGTHGEQGWYNEGRSISCTISSPVAGSENGVQYVCTGWLGTGSVPSSGTSSYAGDFTILEPSSLTWQWKTQYYLSIRSGYGFPIGAGWYDAGSTASWSVERIVNEGDDTRHTADTNYGTVPMNSPAAITINWRTQYRLTALAEPADSGSISITPADNDGFYNEAEILELIATASDNYGFEYWGGDLEGEENTKQLIMNSPKNVTANFVKPVLVVANTTVYGNPNPSAGTHTCNYDQQVTCSITSPVSDCRSYVENIAAGNSNNRHPIDIYYNYARSQMLYLSNELGEAGTIKNIRFYHSNSQPSTINNVTIHTAHTTNNSISGWSDTASHTLVYNGNLVVPSSSGWFEIALQTLFNYDGASNLIISVRHRDGSFDFVCPTWRTNSSVKDRCIALFSNTQDPPVAGSSAALPNAQFVIERGNSKIQYVCTGWTGTGSVPESGATDSVVFNIKNNSTITWSWKTEYYLTTSVLPADSGTITPPSGWYGKDETIEVTAVPDIAFLFIFWSGLLSGAGNPVQLTMNEPKNVTANFSSANIIYVDDENGDDDNDGLTWLTALKTIQEAVNQSLSVDWMVIVADGTYKGEKNRNIDFGGKAVHLKSLNGAVNCIIDCENIGQGFVFRLTETKDTVVEGFTICNANGINGGAVYCAENSNPTITNCIIRNCSAERGGGIYCIRSSPSINQCIIADNSANYGGGIYCGESDPEILNCLFVNNSASVYAGGLRSFNNST